MNFEDYFDDCRFSRGIIEKMGYSYNDLTIIPCVVSDINSRKQCNIFDENNMYHLFAAPMLSVTNSNNIDIWYNNKIYAVCPRSVSYAERLDYLRVGRWVSLSQKEFVKLFIQNNGTSTFVEKGLTYNVCVDLANGHMRELYNNINIAKDQADALGYKLVIMTGNIANPETYRWICEHSRVDYIRLSIGSGAGCLTSSNTGVHFPIASLIDECKKIKTDVENYEYGPEYCDPTVMSIPKIVADGGIRNYSDINKAYALGADYVMVGSLFAGLLESSADMIVESNDPIKYPAVYDRATGEIDYNINYDEVRSVSIWNGHTEEQKQELIRSMKAITKKFIGMSTKEAQIAINAALEFPIIAEKKDLKTSEGCTKFIPCKYTIAQWCENMEDYLRSAMSYCNAHNLNEFRNNTYLIPNSPGEMMAVNK